MKKKKGFTLIELLAVIVILAILMVIAVPKILNVIDKSRMKAFQESADLISHTAQLKYTTSSLDGSISKETYKFENGELTNDSPELNFKGDKPYSGTVVLENGKVSLAIISKNKKYCAVKNIGEKNAKVYNITDEFTMDKCVIGYTGGTDVVLPETDSSCFSFDSASQAITGFSDDYTVEKCKTDIVFPKSIDGLDVLNIRAGAFSGNSNITSIAFNSDSKLTKINDGAFSGATNITKATLPPSLESVGVGSFAGTSLENIDLKNIKTIGSGAFNATKLTSLTIPNTITSIGGGAFGGIDTTLKEISIENSNNVYSDSQNGTILNNIGRTFNGILPNVTKVSIKNIEDINCSFGDIFPNLESVSFDNNLKKISSAASFNNLSTLKTINLSEGLEYIASNSFAGTSITKLTIPSTLTTWEYAFTGMSSLKTVIIKSGITTIPNGAFSDCTNLSSIEIPDTVTILGDYALNNNNLSSITLSKNVTSIGGISIYGDNLRKVTISSNITNLFNSALASSINNSLKEIVLEDGVKEIDFDGYGIISSVEKIVVPKSLTNVKSGSFALNNDGNSLTTICYRGSESEFNNIEVENFNEYWYSANKIYNCSE